MKRPAGALAAVLALALLAGTSPAETPFAAAQKLLASKEWSDRVKGLEQLVEIGKRADTEKAAVTALDDEDWGVQIAAAKTLAKIGGDPAKDALVKQSLDGEIQWVRDAAVESLKTLDAEGGAVRLIERARGTQDPAVKTKALRAAGLVGGKDLLKRLLPFVPAKDDLVAAEALRAIGRLAADPALAKELLEVVKPHLSSRSDKKEFFMYAAAVEALGRVEDPSAAAMLVDEVIEQPDDDLYAPERIARGLEKRPPDQVATALKKGFADAKKPDELRRVARLAGRVACAGSRTDLEALLGHKDERVRSEAARALGLVHDPQSVSQLSKLLDDKSPFVRVEAVTSLARCLPGADFRALGPRIRKDAVELIRLQLVVELADAGDPAGIAEIEPLLADPSWRVATAAASAIGTLGVAVDLPKLQPYVQHKTWQMRAAAYEGLGRLRAVDAIPLLTEGLTDKDPLVKGVCLANLQILCREKLGPAPAAWRDWWTKNSPGLHLVKQSRRTAEEKAKDAERNKDYGNQTKAGGVEILQKARILVTTGAWDHVEKVLEHLAIPFTLIRAQQLKDVGINPNQIILVNCEGNMDEDGRSRIQWFVNVGGYLMTTDWALTHTIEPTFPGYLKQYSSSSTGNDVVVVESASPAHPFNAGVFEGVPALKWWLEIQAFPMTVVWPERTTVLVDSGEMRHKYGSSPMAAVFRWGLGKVQHSISHFFLQEEGLSAASKPRARMIFAADNLGISLDEIRRLAKEGRFDRVNDETMKEIGPDYSMFRLIVNVVKEKSDWVENL